MSSTDHGPGLPRVTLIIPMLNEAVSIHATLMRLQPLRSQGVEVLVVDGGSRDASVALATPLADAVLDALG